MGIMKGSEGGWGLTPKVESVNTLKRIKSIFCWVLKSAGLLN